MKQSKVKWVVWNVDRGAPSGGFTRLKDALAAAMVAETSWGEHHTVVRL